MIDGTAGTSCTVLHSASIADGVKRSVSKSPPQLMCETTTLMSVDLLLQHHKESQFSLPLGFFNN